MPTRVGPYELVSVLGEGGMGTVYRARHVELGTERAVKVLARAGEGWEARRVARFEREVAHLARVRHPNVVAIHEAGLADGRPFFAMDLIEGEPLSAFVERARPSLSQALEVAIALAEGVAALHAEGILHRDLKPDNVVLTRAGLPVVLDLGLAIAPDRDERLTQTGAMVGTLGYMAPEQLKGEPVGPQTDVYALALITYELVTGLSAIPEASSQHELIGRVLHQPRRLPGQVDPELPASLDAVIARATAHDLSRRPADAAAFARALTQVCAARGPRAALSGGGGAWPSRSPPGS